MSKPWVRLNSNTGSQGPAGPPGSSGALKVTFSGSTGIINQAYNSGLIATGGTPGYTYSISSGALPTGLTLGSTTGLIAGTPTAAGTFTFVGMVTDSASATAVTPTCTIVVNGPPEAPSSVVLTEIGPRTIDGNQQTRTTLQVVVQESTSGNLGTSLTANVLETSPANFSLFFGNFDSTGSPTGGGFRTTTITIPNILVQTFSQTCAASVWSSNSYASLGPTGAVTSSSLTVLQVFGPSPVYVPSGATGTFASGTSGTTFHLSAGFPTVSIIGNIIVGTHANQFTSGRVATYNTSTGVGTITGSWSFGTPVPGDPYQIYFGAQLAVTNLAGSSPTQTNIYAGVNGEGNNYWALNVTLTTSGSGDPNAWLYAIWIQWVDSGGNPINPGGQAGTTGWQVFQTNGYNTGGAFNWQLFGGYPAPQVNAYLEIAVWGVSRRVTASVAPYTGDAQAMNQIFPGSSVDPVSGLSVFTVHVGPPPTGNSTNMLVNPSALQAPTVGWTVGGTATVTDTTATLGGQTVSVFQAVASAGTFTMSQSFSARGSDAYFFEIWAAVTSGSVTAQISLTFLNLAGSSVGTPATTSLTGLTGTLQPFDVQAKIPAGAVKVVAAVSCTSSTTTFIFTNCLLQGGVTFPLVKDGNSTRLQTDEVTVSVGPGGLVSTNSGALLNGGFGAGIIAPWSPNGGTWAISQVQTYTAGSYSAVQSASSSSPVGLGQTFAASPGQVVVVKAWVYPDGSATGSGEIIIVFADKSGASLATIGSNLVTATGSWQELLSVTAAAPANTASCYVQLTVNSPLTGNWYFANVTVQIGQPGLGLQTNADGSVGAALSTGVYFNAAGQILVGTGVNPSNMLANPNFNLLTTGGAPIAWTITAGLGSIAVVNSSTVYSGAHSIAQSGPSSFSSVVADLITAVNPGDAYTLSVWVNCNSAAIGDGSIGLGVQFYNAAGSNVASATGPSPTFAATGWQNLNFQFTVPTSPANITSLQVVLSPTANASGATVFIGAAFLTNTATNLTIGNQAVQTQNLALASVQAAQTNVAALNAATGLLNTNAAVFNLQQTAAFYISIIPTISAVGSSYSVGDQLFVSGGTFSVQAKVQVVGVSPSGAVTSLMVIQPGAYTVTPSNPASTAYVGGSGSGFGLTLTVTWGGGALAVNNGINVFTQPMYLSQGNSNPCVALLNTGIFLYSAQSTSSPVLTNNPYVAIQSTGILVAHDATGPSTFVNSSGVFIYAVTPGSPGSSSSSAYMELAAGGITVQSAAISGGTFNGYWFSNVISASGMALSLTNGSAVAASLVMNATQIILSNVSGPSVTITASSVAINQGTLTLVANNTTTSIGNVTVGGVLPIGLSVTNNTTTAVSYVGSGAMQCVGAAGSPIVTMTTLSGNAILSAAFGSANITFNVGSGTTTAVISNLPSSSPGSGTKQLWYDPADSNRIKYAA